MRFEKSRNDKRRLILSPRAFNIHEVGMLISGLGLKIAQSEDPLKEKEAIALARKLNSVDDRHKINDEWEKKDLKVSLSVSELKISVEGLESLIEKTPEFIHISNAKLDYYSCASVAFGANLSQEMIETIKANEPDLPNFKIINKVIVPGHYL